MFELCSTNTFFNDMSKVPEKVRHACTGWVDDLLRERPEEPDQGGKIKKLAGYRDLWRVRVSGEWRLVYRVDRSKKTVNLLMIGLRSSIYDRLGANDDGSPGIRIIAEMPSLVERELSDVEIQQSFLQINRIRKEKRKKDWVETVDGQKGKKLPIVIDSTVIQQIGAEAPCASALLSLQFEHELEDLLAGAATCDSLVLERLLNILYPTTIEKCLNGPTYVVESTRDLFDVADGKKSLDSLMLKLDPDQQSFVSRFEGENVKGPWLLKGGPGSGKSTVALYCIERICSAKRTQSMFEQREPLRVLFTTFTNSLTKYHEYLYGKISQKSDAQVDFSTIDQLAVRHAPQTNDQVTYKVTDFIVRAQAMVEMEPYNDALRGLSPEYIAEEIEWVIEGRNLPNLQAYLNSGREGRGIGLTAKHREALWTLFTHVKNLMKAEGYFTGTGRQVQALAKALPTYDFVFVDEAQDFKQVGIQLCVKLCKLPERVFITADSNQSIYGSGISWKEVAEELRFQGKTKILTNNYRTTVQIWRAIDPLVSEDDAVDPETKIIESASHGEIPSLVEVGSMQSLADGIAKFFRSKLLIEKLPIESCAVLCPENDLAEELAPLLSVHLPAKHMRSREIDMSFNGIKTMTIHAAKGLQFPIVAIVGASGSRSGQLFLRSFDSPERNKKMLRLFYVGASRAMRQLALFVTGDQRQRFWKSLNSDDWADEDY